MYFLMVGGSEIYFLIVEEARAVFPDGLRSQVLSFIYSDQSGMPLSTSDNSGILTSTSDQQEMLLGLSDHQVLPLSQLMYMYFIVRKAGVRDVNRYYIMFLQASGFIAPVLYKLKGGSSARM